MSASYHLCIKKHSLNSLVLSQKETNPLSLARSVITNRSKTCLTKIVTSRQTPKIWKQLETSTGNESILIIIVGRRKAQGTESSDIHFGTIQAPSYVSWITVTHIYKNTLESLFFLFSRSNGTHTHGSWAWFIAVLLRLYFRNSIYSAATTQTVSPVCDALKSKRVGWTFK